MKRLAIVLVMLLGFGGMVISGAAFGQAQTNPADPGQRGTSPPVGSNTLFRYGDDGLVSLFGGTGQAKNYAYYYSGVFARLKPDTDLLPSWMPDGVLEILRFENDSKETSFIVPAGGSPIPVVGKAEQERNRLYLGLAKTWSLPKDRWLDVTALVGRDWLVTGDKPSEPDTAVNAVVSYGKASDWSVESGFARMYQSNINWMRLRGRIRLATFGSGGTWTTDLRGVAEVQNVRLPGGDNNSAGGLGFELALPNAGDASLLFTVDRDDDNNTVYRTEVNFLTIRF